MPSFIYSDWISVMVCSQSTQPRKRIQNVTARVLMKN